jgi:rubrerythrin
MATVTVGDMLKRAKDFERRLEAYYADLRDRATHDGVRLLTYYLARHRRHLPQALKSFSQEQIERISQVILKYDDTDFSPHTYFEGRNLADSVSGEELLGVAIEFVGTLIRFYRWMVQQRLGDEAASLFQSLLQIEEKHIIELKKIKAMDYF